MQNEHLSELHKDFKPFLYNIWNTPKGNETEHFGSFPLVFMEKSIVKNWKSHIYQTSNQTAVTALDVLTYFSIFFQYKRHGKAKNGF